MCTRQWNPKIESFPIIDWVFHYPLMAAKSPAARIEEYVQFIDRALDHPPLPSEELLPFDEHAAMVPEVRELYPIIYELYTLDFAALFRNPVYALSEPGLYSYYEYIAEPRSLRDVVDKMTSSRYSSARQVHDDLNLIWKNCAQYNGEDNEVTQTARKCEAWIRTKIQQLEDQAIVPHELLQDFTDYVEQQGDHVFMSQLQMVITKHAPERIDAENDVSLENMNYGLFRRLQELMEAHKARSHRSY